MSERSIPHELGWDGEISSDSGYILLEEGGYGFTAAAFGRGRFPGSAKTPPCNKAVLTLPADAAPRDAGPSEYMGA